MTLRERHLGESYWPLRGSVFGPSDEHESIVVTESSNGPPSPSLSRSRSNTLERKSAPESPTSKPPLESLILEYVHGYRGHDCRDNLFYLSSGKLVYHCAAVGIVLDPTSNVQKFYTGHNDDIVSLAVHPDGVIVATGQVNTIKGSKKPRICVWNSETLETLAVLEGFHDLSVCALDFSQPDGNFLITVGTDYHNSVCVYDWRKQEVVSQSYGRCDKIFVVKSNPHDPMSFATCGVKHIKFWKMEGATLSSRYGIFKDYSIQTLLSMTYTVNKGEVITGTYSGDIYIWHGNALTVSIPGHKGPVYAVLSCALGLVTSGKDSQVIVWGKELAGNSVPQTTIDLKTKNEVHLWEGNAIVRSLDFRNGKIVVGTKSNEIYELDSKTNQIRILISGHIEELWALASHPTKSVYVTGGNDNTIRLWDLTTRQLIKLLSVEDKVKCLAYSPDGSTIAAGLENGTILLLSSDNLALFYSIKERDNIIDEVKFSPNGTMLAVGSHQNVIDIYAVNKGFQLVSILKGHSSSIMHLDWSTDDKVIQSDSSDYEHLFWDVETGTQIVRTTVVRDLSWATWTCILGWHVKGLFSRKDREGATINALARSRGETIVATADTRGEVKLFNFPIRDNNQLKFKTYTGHSSFVTNVTFSHDDAYVLTTGGNDRTIFQWKVVVHSKMRVKSRSLVLSREDLLPNKNMIKSQLANMDQIKKLQTMHEKGFINSTDLKTMTDIILDTRKERILELLNTTQDEDLSLKLSSIKLQDILK